MADAKITLLAGHTPTEDEILARDLRRFARMAPEIASVKMAFFKAYISEGFTVEQALELCKSVTI